MWSWLRQLAHIVTLLQEQNALTRELIEALTKQPARTTRSPISAQTAQLPPRQPAKLTRQYTAADVIQVTPEMREAQALAEFEQQHRPWRIQDLPPTLQALALSQIGEHDSPPKPR